MEIKKKDFIGIRKGSTSLMEVLWGVRKDPMEVKESLIKVKKDAKGTRRVL